MLKRLCVTILLALGMLSSPLVFSRDNTYVITIRNHVFEPAEVVIPAGVKVKLLVKNLDRTPEEFESYELNREKIIHGGKQAIIYVGPLRPGKYPFFGEFHQKTARGVLIAR